MGTADKTAQRFGHYHFVALLHREQEQYLHVQEAAVIKNNVAIFKPFPFKDGQKIRIEGGPRQGDWLVTGITQKKIRLRCPISGREVEWDRFCYYAENRENDEWPKR